MHDEILDDNTIFVSLFELSSLSQPYLLNQASSEMDTPTVETNFDMTVSQFSQLLLHISVFLTLFLLVR